MDMDHLVSCPFDQRIFSTIFSTSESYEAAIWQILELFRQLNSPQLEQITSFDAHVDDSKKAAQVQFKELAGMLHYLSGGAWDPRDVKIVAATCESSVQFWDLLTMKKATSKEKYTRCAEILVRGSGIDLDSNHRHEGGTNNWIVRCKCWAQDDHGKMMVACDVCEVWQHTRCCGINDFEAMLPLFVCILSACRDLIASSETILAVSTHTEETWYHLLQRFLPSLTKAFCSTFICTYEDTHDTDMYLGVKGLLILATLHKGYLLISKTVFEKVLVTFVPIVNVDYSNKLLWNLALKAQAVGTGGSLRRIVIEDSPSKVVFQQIEARQVEQQHQIEKKSTVILVEKSTIPPAAAATRENASPYNIHVVDNHHSTITEDPLSSIPQLVRSPSLWTIRGILMLADKIYPWLIAVAFSLSSSSIFTNPE
ncbi:hypothetical protein REPUB_Repub10bG0037000 [Reevesia pubescens]